MATLTRRRAAGRALRLGDPCGRTPSHPGKYAAVDGKAKQARKNDLGEHEASTSDPAERGVARRGCAQGGELSVTVRPVLEAVGRTITEVAQVSGALPSAQRCKRLTQISRAVRSSGFIPTPLALLAVTRV